MNLLRYTVRTIIILLVLLSALAVGVALGSMNARRQHLPTPGAPPHIMASIAPVLPTPAIHVVTWTPEALLRLISRCLRQPTLLSLLR